MTPTTLDGKRGIDVLRDPELNKSTAFTETEKQELGIVGLVPEVTETENLAFRPGITLLSRAFGVLSRI